MVVTSCGVSSSMNSLRFTVLKHVDNLITFVFRLVLRKKISERTNKNGNLNFQWGKILTMNPNTLTRAVNNSFDFEGRLQWLHFIFQKGPIWTEISPMSWLSSINHAPRSPPPAEIFSWRRSYPRHLASFQKEFFWIPLL